MENNTKNYTVEYTDGATWFRVPYKYSISAAKHEALCLTYDDGNDEAIVISDDDKIVYVRQSDGFEWEAE